MSCPKKISEKSPLAVDTGLNIFTVPPTNVSILRSHYREILPLSTITQDSPYLFRLYSDNLWTDLSRIYLYLELKIQKKSGNNWVPIEETDLLVGTIQCIGQSFVQQLKVTIGNTDLYDSGTLYPYKTYMTTELSYPDNVKSNFLASSGYYPLKKHNDSTDAGFLSIVEQFASGKKAQFLSRLDFDFGNQELLLLNNMDVLFTIFRSKNSFCIHKLGGATDLNEYRLYVEDVKIYAKMVEVQPSLNLSIYKTLEHQPATYSIRKTEMKSCFLSAGRTSIDYNAFSATIPRRITVAFVENEAFNGYSTKSPFNFKPFDIREISVHAGGQIYPVVPYKMEFNNQSYTRPFLDMYEALGVANSERSFDIPMKKFKEGWTFFVIPLTSTLDDSCGFELLRSGTTSIRVLFNTAIPAGGVEMLVLGEFDQMIMIDYNRHIVSDSNLG